MTGPVSCHTGPVYLDSSGLPGVLVRVVIGWLFVVCELHSGRERLECLGCAARVTGGVVCFVCGQVVKGTRWMPWHQEPMKDVGGCVKPRGVACQAVIRGCPNGETWPESCRVAAV